MIREIRDSEFKEAVEVITRSFMTVADEFGFTAENAPRFVAFATDEGKLLFWKNEQKRPMFGYFTDDRMVGYYNLSINNEECELGSLSVLPEYRHKKIGHQLLEDACERAKALGCNVMKLSIVEENQVLRKWYEDHGFIHEGVKKFDFFPFTCGYLNKNIAEAKVNIEYKDIHDFSAEDLQALFLSVEWSSGHFPDKLVIAMKNYETVYTAWDGDKLVGLICAMDDGSMNAYVHYLLVHPDYHKMKIGRTLVQMVKEHYKDFLRLVVIAYDKEIHFYEDCGFEKSTVSTPMFITSLWT